MFLWLPPNRYICTTGTDIFNINLPKFYFNAIEYVDFMATRSKGFVSYNINKQ